MLLHHWPLTGTGTVATDVVGGADGAIEGGASLNGNGQLVLDGVDDFVDLPNGIVSGLGSATVDLWLTWENETADPWVRAFDFGSSTLGELGPQTVLPHNGQQYVYVTLRANTGEARLATSPDGVDDEVVCAGPPVPADVLHHVVATLRDDGTTMFQRLYIDGVPTGPEVAATIRLADVADVNVFVGRSNFGDDPYLGGRLYDVKVWQGALTADEVMAQYLAAIPVADPLTDLVGHWPLDGTGDEAGGNYPGTATGDVFYGPGVDGQAAYFRSDGARIDTAPIDAFVSGQAGTISAWVRDDQTALNKVIAGMGPPESAPDFLYGTYQNELFFDVGVAVDAYMTKSGYAALVPPGRWHHWVAVYDGTLPTEQRGRLYVDGVDQGVTVGVGFDPMHADLSAMPFFISHPTWTWRGFIDDVRLFHHALPPADVLTLYAGASPPYPQDYALFVPCEDRPADVTGAGGPGLIAGTLNHGPGVVGHACTFDAGAGHIAFSPQSWLGGAEALTLATWFRLDGPSTGGRAFVNVFVSQESDLQVGVATSGTLYFDLGNGVDDNGVYVTDFIDAHAPYGTWHHLAAVFDGALAPDDRGTIYVDGAAVPTTSTLPLPAATNSLLGSAVVTVNSGTIPFNGAVDELHLYPRALSPDEVQTVYDATRP